MILQELWASSIPSLVVLGFSPGYFWESLSLTISLIIDIIELTVSAIAWASSSHILKLLEFSARYSLGSLWLTILWALGIIGLIDPSRALASSIPGLEVLESFPDFLLGLLVWPFCGTWRYWFFNRLWNSLCSSRSILKLLVFSQETHQGFFVFVVEQSLDIFFWFSICRY